MFRFSLWVSICIYGGGPTGGEYDSYLGGRHWSNPGAFANGFKGVCAVFVTAAFSFGNFLTGRESGPQANLTFQRELSLWALLLPKPPILARLCPLLSRVPSGVL